MPKAFKKIDDKTKVALNKKELKMKKINQLLGITYSNEVVYVDSFHSSGVSLNYFDPISQEYIDAENDLETVKDHYGYLWQEAVSSGTTEASLEEFMEQLMENDL